MNFQKILVLAPHTDDGAIGAGGLIRKLTGQNCTVHYAAFSSCEESIPDGLPKNILATEVLDATAELGIPAKNVSVFRFEVRRFPEFRQEILDEMIKLQRAIEPDLVIMPSKFDSHQDHEVICQEGTRAFKNSTMIGYEIPWNNVSFEANLLVPLDEGQVKAKVKAFSMYKSQAFRNYRPEDLETLAMSRGLQIKKKYAEAYNIIRWLWH